MTAPTVAAVDAVLGAAAMLMPVRELEGNRGRFIEAMQFFTGGRAGDPWCADLVYYVGAHVLGSVRWPLPRTGSCDEVLRFARARGILRERPARGHVFLVLKSETDAVHAGFVDGVFDDASWRSREGNSNELGAREGIGVYANTRGTSVDTRRYVFVDWPALVPGSGA